MCCRCSATSCRFAAAIIALWLIDVALDVARYFGFTLNLPEQHWIRMILRR